ncbi:uncharacterized protein [Parasteatoda tepidariorum]|uniref:uncharacterized protein isoform X2 n=1 Tax=Parasteatoda tepidariorum TaxID=114398 RepID=UPI00077FAE2A|nr:uncharacterized protein LOC107440862 isoform X2 [Parasteatoda tepidariorum]
MSRDSHRTLSSGSSRHRSTVDRHSAKGRNTKCIITIGILLPLCAAVIGIAAWSLTTDSTRDDPQSMPIYQDSYLRNGKHPDWFGKRKDELGFGAKLPIGASMNKHELGPDIVPDDRELITAPSPGSVEVLPAPPEATSTDKDPLYVVHYVPEDKPKEEFLDPRKPHPDSVNVLQKILSDSKGKSGNGSPQFIVIAPMPPKEDDVDDYDDDDEEEQEAVPRKKKKKGRKSRRKDHKSDLLLDQHTESSQFRHHVEPAHRKYESTESQEQHEPPRHHHEPPHHHQTTDHYQQDPSHKHQQPASHHHQAPPHHYRQPPHRTNYAHESQRNDNYYHHHHHQPTPAPAPSVSITIMPSFGLLRSILRPKFDLKKKLFFGIQLENGIGFGGHTDAPPTTAAPPTTKPPPHHGGGGVHIGGGGGHHSTGMSFYEE